MRDLAKIKYKKLTNMELDLLKSELKKSTVRSLHYQIINELVWKK